MEGDSTPLGPAGLRGSPTWRPLRPLIIFGTAVLITASLYWARDVLIPLALATLLTFLLNPLANLLQRWRLGRGASVLVVVGLAFTLIAGAGWALTQQVSTLGNDVPKYTAVIKEKLARWRREGGGRFLGRVRSGVDEVMGEFEKTVPPREKPMPVVVQGGPRGLLEQVTSVTEPLATAGLVALLVVFMLFERVELRNRLIRLVGYGRVTLTTKALDEAAGRISRYLLGQTIINTSLGLVFAVGLALIGLPYALLWGALLAVLRFIPYVGVWLAVLPPMLFSLAVFDGWAQPLSVAALFVILELLASAVVEPVVYSQHAGVSKVALLVAIAVWTWLWGPVGLVLATPMTVCLLVVAKYMPEMDFVAVLVGDEPALAPPVAYYQRLLAGDREEAGEIVREFLENNPVEHLYDALLVPALVTARRDLTRGRLSDDAMAFIVRATYEVMEEVVPDEPRGGEDATRVRLLGCPARDKADEVALEMLRCLVDPARFEVDIASADVLTSEVLAMAEATRPSVICLSSLPPGGLAQARYLCKRLRARHPDVKIVVGRWGHRDDLGAEHGDVLIAVGADHVSTSLLEARDHLAQLAALEPAAPAAVA
jgi:predicted PurR-regulated permease PerM